MNKKYPRQGEIISQGDGQLTSRLKVHGGWIFHSFFIEEDGMVRMKASSETSCFIPDPNHEWELEDAGDE